MDKPTETQLAAARNSLGTFQTMIDDYRAALTILVAVLPAVDEARLSQDVRAVLVDVRAQTPPALRDLDEVAELLAKQVRRLTALRNRRS